MIYKSKKQILDSKKIEAKGKTFEVKDIAYFKNNILPNLVDTIILSESKNLKNFCYQLAYSCGLSLGIYPASIQALYRACGKKETGGFCVPAINLRTLTFELAQTIFEIAKKINSNLFIFEIAESEIGYTWQSPQEYSALVTLAAIKQDYSGPLFFQGDHFQVEVSKYKKDPKQHIKNLKKLIKQSIDAGFYNIDIDSSTLVDLSKKELDAQQKLNYKLCAYFTKYLRKIQPKGVEISIGGEIGEVGGVNSEPKDLNAFMQGYLKEIAKLEGISKISVQTGTKHGGVVLPDGSIAKAKIDLNTLDKLSKLAKDNYQLAGAVQHGASTLPNEAFHHFPKRGCIEVHLATQFQNIIYDYMPLPLKEKIYSWLDKNCYQERKKEWTDDQFIYRLRKKALGPFKKEIYQLPTELKDKIKAILSQEFSFLFDKLNLKNKKNIVDKYIRRLT
ncbi:MAG: class II fructose-bisphosphate aldolase [Candidatus Omnitrophica bacterium]|nr:class II fructose-bisphosphate aldolase [Candidatus Omnitrophota bacterium]MCF7894242.1 class II fructose-bisphosphate aldolase [Candidatus Omnitrophota bacterium]